MGLFHKLFCICPLRRPFGHRVSVKTLLCSPFPFVTLCLSVVALSCAVLVAIVNLPSSLLLSTLDPNSFPSSEERRINKPFIFLKCHVSLRCAAVSRFEYSSEHRACSLLLSPRLSLSF